MLREHFKTAKALGLTIPLTTQAFELEAKQLELLRLAMPSLERIAVLTNAGNVVSNSELNRLRNGAAQALQIELLEGTSNNNPS